MPFLSYRAPLSLSVRCPFFHRISWQIASPSTLEDSRLPRSLPLSFFFWRFPRRNFFFLCEGASFFPWSAIDDTSHALSSFPVTLASRRLPFRGIEQGFPAMGSRIFFFPVHIALRSIAVREITPLFFAHGGDFPFFSAGTCLAYFFSLSPRCIGPFSSFDCRGCFGSTVFFFCLIFFPAPAS